MKKAGYFLCLFIYANMLFPAKLAVLPGHITPQKMCMDDQQIYIAEGPEVFIYSLKDFKLIKRFGNYDSCPFAFRKGKFYLLIENEDTEEWELHVHEVINY